MAINRDAFELICWAKRQSQSPWDQVLTLGRQAVVLQPWDLTDWKETSGGKLAFDSFLNRNEDASAGEELIKHLGANHVNSMDVSAYEGASILHNLNQPVPEHLRLSFDMVYDGGTLEHVFDYPEALRNALSMVKEGGWFLSITPSNMWCGHGFYQLGPDVFRTILTAANGFELRFMAFALSTFSKEYWIWDPAPGKENGRLGTFSKHPACLLIAAKRISPALPEKLSVEQPDYVSRWENPPAQAPSTAPKPVGFVRQIASRLTASLPWSLRGRLRHWNAWKKAASRHEVGLRKTNSLR